MDGFLRAEEGRERKNKPKYLSRCKEMEIEVGARRDRLDEMRGGRYDRLKRYEIEKIQRNI